jgi:hypothetical protein
MEEKHLLLLMLLLSICEARLEIRELTVAVIELTKLLFELQLRK